MAMYDYQGVVEEVGQTQTVGSNGFTKRDIIVGNDVDTENRYPNPVKFTFKRMNCSLLDSIQKGQRVSVRFAIDGRRWDRYQDRCARRRRQRRLPRSGRRRLGRAAARRAWPWRHHGRRERVCGRRPVLIHAFPAMRERRTALPFRNPASDCARVMRKPRGGVQCRAAGMLEGVPRRMAAPPAPGSGGAGARLAQGRGGMKRRFRRSGAERIGGALEPLARRGREEMFRKYSRAARTPATPHIIIRRPRR